MQRRFPGRPEQLAAGPGAERQLPLNDHQGPPWKRKRRKGENYAAQKIPSDDEDPGVCPDPRSRIPRICVCKRCRRGEGHSCPWQVPGKYLSRIHRHRLADLPGGECPGGGHRSYQHDGGRAGYRYERRPDAVPGPRQHPRLSGPRKVPLSLPGRCSGHLDDPVEAGQAAPEPVPHYGYGHVCR